MVLELEAATTPVTGVVTFSPGDSLEVGLEDSTCVGMQPSRGGRYRLARVAATPTRLRFDIIPAEALNPGCFKDQLRCELPATSYTIDLAIAGQQMQGLGQGRDEFRLRRCSGGCLR